MKKFRVYTIIIFNLDLIVKNPLGVMPVRDNVSGTPNLMNLRDSGFRRNDTKTVHQAFYEFGSFL